MKRFLKLIIVIMTLYILSGCTKVSTDFFPMDTDTEWKYSYNSPKIKGEIVRSSVSSVKLDQGEGTIMQFKKTFSDEEYRELYEKRVWGIYAYKRVHPAIGFVETNMEPPQPFLKLPLQAGDKWNWKGKIFGMGSSSTFSVETKEDIKVGKKKYNCYKVVERGDAADGRSFTSVRWYSPGFGLVREDSTVNLRGDSDDRMVMELNYFKVPAK